MGSRCQTSKTITDKRSFSVIANGCIEIVTGDPQLLSRHRWTGFRIWIERLECRRRMSSSRRFDRFRDTVSMVIPR